MTTSFRLLHLCSLLIGHAHGFAPADVVLGDSKPQSADWLLRDLRNTSHRQLNDVNSRGDFSEEGPIPTFSVDKLIPGKMAHFEIAYAAPGTFCHMVYSIHGKGETTFAGAGITVDLQSASVYSERQRVDEQGHASWQVRIPGTVPIGTVLHFQAVIGNSGYLSNVVTKEVSANCVGPGADLIVDQGTLARSIDAKYMNSDDSCAVDEGCFTGLGMRRVLRFSTMIANIGCEDYHIGRPPSDISVSERGWNWHVCHGHWHYENYAHYWIEPICIKEHMLDHPVYTGHKNGWCVMDIGGYQDYYPPTGLQCNRDCSDQGISAGCQDTYSKGLDCQWIDITEVPAGLYVLAVATNWNEVTRQDTTPELDYSNNVARVPIRISDGDVEAITEQEVMAACGP